MALRLGGLASGLDTESIVGQLMALERQPRNRLEQKQQVAEARKQTLTDIQGRLKALQTAVADLRGASLFQSQQKVETSDAARVGVSRTGGVATGAYMVAVSQVAGAEQRSYTWTPPADATSVVVDGHSTAIGAGATLADAIAAINGDAEGKVWASDVGGKLALSWRSTGRAANDDVVSSGALSGETLLRAGKAATFTVDGTAYTSDSNEVTSIPGLTLTLKAPTSADVAITVGPSTLDTTAIKDKLKNFVKAYNEANDLMRNELREEKVRNAGNRVDRGKGVLRGDAGIAGLQSQLRQALGATIATGSSAMDQLADLGVTTGAVNGTSFSRDAVNGTLVLDEAKLDAALAAEPTRAKQLLGGTGAGIAQGLESVLNAALGADGTFASRLSGADAEIARFKDQMTAFDERLELRERNLRSIYTRLEQAMAQSQTRGSAMAASLAGMFGQSS